MSQDAQTETVASATPSAFVVVGEVVSRTETEVQIAYPSVMGDATLRVNRTEFGHGGSIGHRLDDTITNENTDRAFAIKRCVCPTCNGNNDGNEAVMSNKAGKTAVQITNELNAVNSRRQAFEVDDVRHVQKCPTCNGKGKISELTGDLAPQIDGEWGDLVEDMCFGNGPAPAFASSFNGRRGGIVDNITDMQMKFSESMQENIHGDMVGNGVFTIFNTGYASEENNFLGKQMGRPKTDVYAFAQHSTVIDSFADWASSNGMPFTCYGTNYGQDAIIDIRITDGATRSEVIADLKQRVADGEFGDTGYGLMKELREAKNNGSGLGVVGFGVQIRHSFDGALTIRGVAERVACLNGMVGTEQTLILSAQHKKGVFENILASIGNLAEIVFASVCEMMAQYNTVESMQDIMLGPSQLEALVALKAERGLVSYPSIGQDAQLTGGRQFRAFNAGMVDPNQAWVAVGDAHDGSTVGSLYHAYQNDNGIIGHQPAVWDAHGRVDGGKAVSFAKTNADLAKQHSLYVEIQQDAVRAFTEHVGRSPQDGELNEFVQEFGIPMLNAMTCTEARSEQVGKEDSFGNITIREWEVGDILPTIVKNVGTDSEVQRTLDLVHTPVAVMA
jgi:hypothetical protein